MRDRVVPYPFPAQRTKAKMLPASKETTRRWRSMMCCSTLRPKRIRFSTCFLIQRSSTYVSSLMRCPGDWEEIPREQIAQHFGDGDSAPEGCDLDTAAEFGRDVDREPG